MTEIVQPTLGDRRRVERRTNQNLAELTLPELRRMLVTTTLFIIVLVLFLYIVRTVIIATILGVVVAVYLRPAYLRLLKAIPNKTAAATLTLLLVIVPLIALLVSAPVLARDNGQWTSSPANVRQWFQQLMQPDNPRVSCCGEADAFEADNFEVEGDH